MVTLKKFYLLKCYDESQSTWTHVYHFQILQYTLQFSSLNLRLNQNLSCSLNSTGTKNPYNCVREVSRYFLVREFCCCCCCLVCLFFFSPKFTFYFTSPFGNYFGGVLFTTWYSIWIFICFNALRCTKNIYILHIAHHLKKWMNA